MKSVKEVVTFIIEWNECLEGIVSGSCKKLLYGHSKACTIIGKVLAIPTWKSYILFQGKCHLEMFRSTTERLYSGEFG